MKQTISFLILVAAGICFAAPNPPTAEDPMISITPVTRSMEQTGGSAAINTAGSGTWRASTSANWILLTSSSGTAGYPVGYTVGANNGVEARVGYVYVSGYVHTITQAGLGATLESYSAAFEREGGSGSVRVNAPSGKAWHAQSNADWIAVSTESGTGASACAFTVAPYDEVSTRSGTLTIADNTFTVFQTGRRMKLGAASATTDYFAGTVKIRVNVLADTAWTVSADADWLTVTDAGSGLGGDEVKVSVAENQSYNPRTGTVTIGTEPFVVTQLGRTALIFRIAPTEVGTFGVDGAAGERLAVTATPDLGWTAVASADWIELYEGYGSGSGSGSVVYKVKPNPTLSPRSGSITVTAADGAVAAKRLDIAQEAAVASLTVEEYEFEAAGESLAVGVNTGSFVEWGVTNLPVWLSVSAASSTGPADITLTAAANTSVQPRSATIRIADHEFRVSQKGRGVTVAYEPHVFDADGKATGENADNPITVTADADVTWTAVASDDTWIIVYEGRTGQGNGTVRFIVAPYVGDGEVRTGLITIGSEIVYVTQRPYDLSIDPIGSRVDGNAGAGEIQVALDIDGVWNAIATEPWIAIVSGYDAGTGNGKVLFSYTDNNTGRQRTGKIIIAGETYTLTQAARQLVAVAASAGGRGGAVTGGGTYERDSEIALEAVPEAGYAFDHWVLPGGGTSTENPLSVAVTAAGSYQAFFSPLAPRLSVASASLRGVALEWTDLPWATELRVFRGTSSNRAQATKIATVANDGSCAYLDATGTENRTYWYWVEAVGVEDDVWSEGVQGKREKATFSIDYTNLRGTTHANPATYREGTAVSFSAPSSRTGFTFLGWTPSGITADTSGDVTARANWAQNEYTVRFDLAGAAGSMADEPFTYGLWKYLSPTNFSRPGYTFLGWAVKPTAAVAVYDDSESVKSLTAEPDGIVTLYALWRRDGLEDPLPDLGSSASSSDIVAVLVGCVDAGNLGANITSAAEYADFRAWADAVRDGSGAAAGHTGVRDSPHAWLSYALGQGTLLETAPEPGNLVILDFAASESDPSRFDLLFGLDGIAVGSSAKSANLMKMFAIEGAESLEDGFTEDAVETFFLAPFGGDIAGLVQPAWDSDFFFFRVIERPLLAPSPCTTISFDSAGGSPVSPISQVCGTSVARPADPTRTGYTFVGWSPAFPATMPDADTTLVANWTPIQYTIHFDANGGMGEMPDFGYTCDMDSADCGLDVRYYDISSSGYSTWSASEAALKNYFASRTPTIETTTAKWGTSLDPGFAGSYSGNDASLIQSHGSTVGLTNRFDGKYATEAQEYIGAYATGRLFVDSEGTYSFRALADDYIAVFVDGTRLCRSQWANESSGQIALTCGWHTISIGFQEITGGHGFVIEWKRPGDMSWTPLPQTILFQGESIRISDCAFAKAGYSFAGWATKPDGEIVYGNGESASNVFTDNDETTKTLYAVWSANQYTISFDSSGGSTVSTITQDCDTAVTDPADPTRTGYAFAGWSPVIPATMPPSNVVCVAQWTPNHYTIRFDANGGTGEMEAFDCTCDETISLPGCTLSGPNGAAFLGWSTTAGGLVEFADTERISNLSLEDGDVISFYAKWNRGSFTIHFDANGGTGEMPDQTFALDVPQNLASDAFSKLNHFFSGWATNETGEVVYGNEAMVYNLAVAGATMTLWAVWESGQAPYCVVDLSAEANASSYPVLYLAEPPSGGFNTDEYKTSKLVLRRLAPGPVPTRDATITKPFYVGLFEVTQKQWSLVMGNNPSYFSGNTRPVDSVSYNDIRGSSLGSQWPMSNAVDADSFLGLLRARTSLDFDLPTEAQWEYACRAGTTTLYSCGDGADGDYMWNYYNSSSQTHEVGTKLPNAWGLYDMHGNVWERCLDWYSSDASLSGDDPVGLSAGSDRALRGGWYYCDLVFSCYSGNRIGVDPSDEYNYCGFRLVLPLPKRYTIHFDANGGTGEMSDLDCTCDETITLPGCMFSGSNGAAFLGWSTTVDGLVEFADEERVSNLSAVDGDMVNLYAKWNRGSFTVHFDANGGTGEMADQEFTLDVPQNLATNAFSKPNHFFAGWATNETGDVVYGNGVTVHNLVAAGETTTLWAIWELFPQYMIVDLSSGENASFYPVTYLAEPPLGGFNTDEYKTTKLVLRCLKPGPIPTRDAAITKHFYVGLFEVTQKQYSLVIGSNPSSFSGDKRPVERITYNAIRGASLGAQWPASNAVDTDSFLGKLRARTGLDFDLPTEAQWEYACRAGTTTDYSYGDSADGAYMWYSSNSSSQTHEVGTKLPNAWGLFDMHGNVWEWCLDRYDQDYVSLSGNDPVGSSSGSDRMRRGGSWAGGASDSISSARIRCSPSGTYDNNGFRLVRTLSE